MTSRRSCSRRTRGARRGKGEFDALGLFSSYPNKFIWGSLENDFP
jgi:hypothetical protein